MGKYIFYISKMVKKSIYLCIIIFFTINNNAVLSQNIKGAIAFGFNTTQVDGDMLYGFNKFGFNIGAIAIIPFRHNISVSLETAFSQKGSRAKAINMDSLDGSYKLSLNYLEIPLLINYTDKNIISAGTGLSVNKLTSYTEVDKTNLPYSQQLKEKINPYDIDWIFNVNIRLYKGLFMNLRYSYSLTKIRTVYFYNKTEDFGKQYNNVLTFRLMYIFKDKRGE
jgi:hypothetical protein